MGLDPREEDLKTDNNIWEVVLSIAQNDDPEVFGVLHGFRCMGAQMFRFPGSISMTARINYGFDSEEHYQALRKEWLLPLADRVVAILEKSDKVMSEKT